MNFSSAHEAFKSLNMGEKLDKRFVSKKLRQLAKAIDIKIPRHVRGANHELWYLFRDELQLLSKPLRWGQSNDTGSIIIFCDCYNCWDLEWFVKKCADKGIVITPFELKYPRFLGEGGYVPDKKLKIIQSGYSYLYRGCLHGIIINA